MDRSLPQGLCHHCPSIILQAETIVDQSVWGGVGFIFSSGNLQITFLHNDAARR